MVKKQERRGKNWRVDWSVKRFFRDAPADHSNIYLSNIVSRFQCEKSEGGSFAIFYLHKMVLLKKIELCRIEGFTLRFLVL
jgi:hypothetical protein